MFLPFKVFFLLDTRDPSIEESFFGGGGAGGGGGGGGDVGGVGVGVVVISISGSQLWKNARNVVKASSRRRCFSSNFSLL